MSERSDHFDPKAADQEAADWIARRDRGLSAAEQDDYLQWLHEDARRAAIIARHEATVRRLKNLAHWQPAQSSDPNPDLFARPRRRWWRGVHAISALAVAAALVVGGLALRQRPTDPPPMQVAGAQKSFLRVNERQVLADGSIVELRDGSRIEVEFSEMERRVRLTGGEAHFTVATNPAWPFVVEAGKVAVRAVGTAFAVRLDATLVDVVVTEGKVRLETPRPPSEVPVATENTPVVTASHRAVISLAIPAAEPQVTPVSAEQMKDMLAWQAPRFQFYETPLVDAVAEFNRSNRLQLQIGDPELATVPIGGTFRVDHVEGFVHLLEITLRIQSERQGDDTVVLKRAR